VCLALAASAGTASATKINKADFLKFINCPIEKGKVCLYGETLKGEFKLGNKSVAVTVPTILQGGLPSNGFGVYDIIPPRFGVETLGKAAQPVPGGLTGLNESIGGPLTATAELAGEPTVRPLALGFASGVAVELPIKVHLENEELGPNCYIGSNTEPITLNLTDGKTYPPEGSGIEVIEGSVGENSGPDKGEILQFLNNKLVDNTFAVPAAKDCGTNALLEPIITGVVNTDEGLPAAAGKNLAILEGNQYESFSTYVAKRDRKALKEKEKAEHPKK
jgi:hypothetical protein